MSILTCARRFARLIPILVAIAATVPLMLANDGCGRGIFPFASPGSTNGPIPTGTSSTSSATATAAPSSTATTAARTGSANAAAAQATASPGSRHYLYASNFTDGTVSEFSRASDTGALTFIDKITAGAVNGPVGIAIDPGGKFLYVANQADRNIHEFTIAVDGKLSPIAGANSIAAGTAPQMLAIDATGKWLYATDASGSIFQFAINQGSGALTTLGKPLAGLVKPFGIIANPSDGFIYVTDNGAGFIYTFAIAADGTLTQNGAPTRSLDTSGAAPGLMAIDSAAKLLFVTDVKTGVVSEFAIGSGGELSPLATSGTAQNGKAVGIVATANNIFVANADQNSIEVFLRRGNSITASSPGAAANAPTGLAIDAQGKFIYVADSADATITELAIDGSCGETLCPENTYPSEMPMNRNAGTQFLATTP